MTDTLSDTDHAAMMVALIEGANIGPLNQDIRAAAMRLLAKRGSYTDEARAYLRAAAAKVQP